MRSFRRDLLIAVPAMLMFVGVAAVVFGSVTRKKYVGRYQNQARSAFGDKEYAWALKCYLKAEQLTPEENDPQIQFEKAFSLGALGRDDDALGVMKKVADENDFVPARLWMIRHRVASRNLKPEELEGMRKELEEILKDEPKSVEAHRLMVPFQAQLSGMAAAIPHLEKLAVLSPEDRLRLAAAYGAVQQQEKVKVEVQRILTSVGNLLEKKPDDFKTRLVGVQANILVKDFNGALQLLNDGMRRLGPQENLVRTCSTVFLAWAEELSRASDFDADAVLQKLILAARFKYVDQRVYHRLAAFSTTTGRDGEEAKRALVSALARGESPALIHTMLGDLAHRDGDVDQAIRHWQLALELDPNSTVLMNNLAWGLTWQKEPKLDAALALVEKALSKAPDSPHLRDTRGQILFKLGRTEEALKDLNAAAASLPNEWRLHATLGEIYQKLQMPQMAAEFLAKAQKLRTQQAAAPVTPNATGTDEDAPPPPAEK